MTADQKLWQLLFDKLELLRTGERLPEAVRVAETALEVARRGFAPGAREIAQTLERLGQLREQQGDRAGAKPFLVEAHQVLEEADPPDHDLLYRSARRLALLCDHLGEEEESIRFYERAIRAASKIPDMPYSDLGTMLNNVAMAYRKSGRGEAAEPYYLHALELYEKQLGPEHPDVASVLNNLAVFYTNERRFPEAEKMHLRALAIREKAFPSDHPDIAQSKCNLAVVYHSSGDYQRASELYRASLKTWEETTLQPTKDYEIVTANYADLLRSLGKARKASQLEDRARKRLRAGR